MKLKPEEIQVGDVFEERDSIHWEVVSIGEINLRIKWVGLGHEISFSKQLVSDTYNFIKAAKLNTYIPYPDRS